MNSEPVISERYSGPRVTPRLGPALGGVMRLTWAQHWTLRNLIWTGLVISGLGGLGYLIGSRGEDMMLWVNQVVLTLSVPIFALEAGARAIREDLKPGAVDYIITRAVPRWAYAVFKYMSQWLVTVAAGLATLAVMLIIGLLLDVPLDSAPRQIVVLVAGVSAFQALGFFLGSITSRYILLGLLYAGVVEAAVGSIPLQLANLSILRHLWAVLGYGVWGADDTSLAQELGLLAGITLALGAAAVLIFSRREFIGKKSDEA